MADRPESSLHVLDEGAWRRSGRWMTVIWLVGLVGLLVVYVVLIRRDGSIPLPWLLALIIAPSLLLQILAVTCQEPLRAVVTLPISREEALRSVETVLSRHGRRAPKVAMDGTSVTVRWFSYRWMEARRLRVRLTSGNQRTGLTINLWSHGVQSASQRWLEGVVEELRIAADPHRPPGSGQLM